MSNHERVTEHYAHGDLLGAITSGITQLGKTLDTVTIEDLAPVDEFHIGGRRASEDFLDQLGLSDQHHLLDVGCGLGGTARFVADRYKSRGFYAASLRHLGCILLLEVHLYDRWLERTLVALIVALDL